MSLNLPPTVMLVDGRQPTDGWNASDKKLAMAWTILQKETCPQCGQPLWICRSNNKNLLFSIRKDTCYAYAELEKWQKGKNSKLKNGEHPYIVPKMRNDEPMPTRKQYLTQISED